MSASADPRLPLGTVALYAVRNFWSSLTAVWAMYAPWDAWSRQRPGYGYNVAPWYVWPVWALLGAPVHAFSQAYAWFAHAAGWPWGPHDAACAWVERVDAWVEPRVAYYAWLPADSGDPDEIGFHYRSDLLTKGEPDEDGIRPYVNRPRIFDRSKPREATSGGTVTCLTWGGVQ